MKEQPPKEEKEQVCEDFETAEKVARICVQKEKTVFVTIREKNDKSGPNKVIKK